MPNHVLNKVKAAPHVIASMLNEEGRVDFSQIIQAPTCLADFQPSYDIVERAKCAVGAQKFDGPEILQRLHASNVMRDITTAARAESKDDLLRAINNWFDCGYVYWRDFNTENWGTKWNAYESEVGNDELQFQTAWTHPEKVFVALSASFPRDRIEVTYADEDLGSNCQSRTYLGGEVLESEDIGLPGAFAAWYPNDDPRSHGYDENWEYSDELYEKHCTEHLTGP